MASALAGLATASQAPEFAQQYRQRLGGAVGELREVVFDFDRDAIRSGLSRGDALTQMLAAPTGFIRDRGASMKRTMGRYEKLFTQLAWLETAPPIERPLIVLRDPDSRIASAAWEVFEPALPLTTPGMVYGAAGAVLFGLIARLLTGTHRRYRRWRSRIRVTGRDVTAA